MDWWQIILILSTIGVISIITGMVVGIPLSKLVLRHRNQSSIVEYPIYPNFESLHKYTTDQFDNLLKEYGLSEIKTVEQDRVEIVERENDKTDVVAEQVEPAVIDRILLELEKNRELSVESSSDKLLTFQTHTWDGNHDVLVMVPADLKWELTQAYLDMHYANNIVWVHTKIDRKSPELVGQYVGICSQVSDRLGKIIPVLESTKQIAT